MLAFDPEQLSVREIYNLMVGLITPRPIAWISTISPDGVANLAPFSFFNGVGANPPTIVFCPANGRNGQPKDTLANILQTEQFVVNVVTFSDAAAMNATAESVPPETDEFELASLKKTASSKVSPPRVTGAAAAMECRLHTHLPIGSGPGGANLVVGQVVMIHLSDQLMDESGNFDPARLDTIGRMGGGGYSRTTQRFEIE